MEDKKVVKVSLSVDSERLILENVRLQNEYTQLLSDLSRIDMPENARNIIRASNIRMTKILSESRIFNRGET